MIILTVICSVVLSYGSEIDSRAEESQDYETENGEESDNTICLSDCNTDIVITDKESIDIIMDEYDLGDSEDVEEIYYSPIEDSDDMEEEEISREVGANEYYVKKKGSSEKKGRLLRSSVFEAPGGTMTISEKVETTVSFSNTASVSGGMKEVKAELSSTYGFNVSKSITCSDTQKVNVKKGCTRNCKAYVNVKQYNYELWEDDQWYDDYIGKGSIKRPVGVIFVLGKNVEKK